MAKITAINPNVLFIDKDRPIQEAVKVMVDREISSILVTEKQKTIVGIITERDILRKFTLLDLGDKLSRNAGSLMTRPVIFAHLPDYRSEIIALYLEKKIRHFPILKGSEPLVENVMGIVSVNDLFRQVLMKEANQKKSEDQELIEKHKKKLVITCKDPKALEQHVHLFSGLDYVVDVVDSIDALINKYTAKKNSAITFLCDLDYYREQELRDFVGKVKLCPFKTLLLSSNPELVAIMRKFSTKDQKIHIAFKPIDLSYCHWLIMQGE